MAALPPMPADLTVQAIYAHYEAKQDDGFRQHLGASLIGGPCDRALWYTFHWAARARHTGRMLRLFRTGDLQEDRMVSDLRSIGVKVMSVDPDTGAQWSLRDATGHFGGSMDAVALGFPEAPETWHLVEFKTHNVKSFTALKKDGVRASKPQHFAQMMVYCYLAGLERAMYLAVCKDNDEIYQERLDADPAEGARLTARAARIVKSPVPLTRIANTSAWFECRFCDHHPVCWEDAVPPRTCRSCLHSTAIANGGWHCERHDKILSLAEQKAGCAAHLYIPDLIAGECVDEGVGAGEDWAEYRMKDGTLWRDGGSHV